MTQRTSFGALVVAIVSAIAVMFGGFAVPKAMAQNTANIVVDKVNVEKASKSEGDELKRWDLADFTLDWHAPDGVADGQQFTVTYPEQFIVFKSEDFVLRATDEDGVEKNGGNCHVSHSDRTITCTFNGEFENKDDVRGYLKTRLQAQQQYDQDTTTLTIDGGRQVTVDLPGNKGIVGPDTRFYGEFDKQGWYNSDASKGVWSLNLPGGLLEGKGDITFTDTLDGVVPHKFEEETIDLTVADYTCGPTDYSHICNYEEGKFDNQSVKVAKREIAADGKSVTFTLQTPEGGWKKDHYYRVRYHSVPTGDVPAGAENITSNKVTADVIDFNDSASIYREQRSAGGIQGVDRGSYQINKKVEGDAASKLPADTSFTFKATYSLNGQTKTETRTVKADGSVAGETNLPRGTVVTLEEIDLPKVDGIEWGDPVFAAASGHEANVEIINGGKAAKVTVHSTDNVEVVVTNKPSETPPTTTPPTTPPSTTPPATTPPTTTPPATPPSTTPPTTPPSSTPPATESTTPPSSTPPATESTTPPATESTTPNDDDSGSGGGGIIGLLLLIPLLAGLAGLLIHFFPQLAPRYAAPGEQPAPAPGPAPAPPSNPKSLPKK